MAAREQAESSRHGLASAAGVGTAVLGVLFLAQQAIEKLGLRSNASILLILIVGFVGFLSQRLVVLARRQRERRENDQAMRGALIAWPEPKASKIDIFDLGVYPPVWGDRNLPYVERDADAELAEAINKAAFVLVHGPARSGKSRTALEVLRAERCDAFVLAPEDAKRLGDLIATRPEQPAGPEGAVLWLDKLERFLSNLPLNALGALTDRHSRLQVLATINDDKLLELAGGENDDAHTLRRLVARSERIPLPSELSDGELTKAGAICQYANLDFSGGFEGAFSGAWEHPITLREPAVTPAHKVTLGSWLSARIAGVKKMRRERRLLEESFHSARGFSRWLLSRDRLAVVLMVPVIALVMMTARVASREGLVTPPSIASQLSALDERLQSCRIAFSTTDARAVEHGEPLVVTTKPQATCPDRADPQRPVLVYTVSHDRLRRVYAFGPPGELSASKLSSTDFRFECRGTNPSDQCWTNISGEQNLVIIGGFYSRSSKMIFPVGVAEANGKFEAVPLLVKPLSLEKRFSDSAYAKPFTLAHSNRTGYYVYDFAVVKAPSDDEDVPAARFVAGFAPPGKTAAPNSLQVGAFLLGMTNQHPVLSERCSSVHLHEDIVMRVKDGDPKNVLATGWKGLERAARAKVVCY
jgi:hypothetical protein